MRTTTTKPHRSFVSTLDQYLGYAVTGVAWLVSLFDKFTNEWAALPLGVGTVYMFLLNVEGYYNLIGASQAFLYKPGIADNPRLSHLLVAVTTAPFWVSVSMSLATSAICATWWRDRKSVAQAKREYDEVKNIIAEPCPENAIDLASHRRKKLIKVGMRRARASVLLFAVCMLADAAQAVSNYPLFGSLFLLHLLWGMFSIVGSEMFLAAFLDAWERLRATPKVEVV